MDYTKQDRISELGIPKTASTLAMRRFSWWLHRGPFSSDDEMWKDFNENHNREQRDMFYDTWVSNLCQELWEENVIMKAKISKAKTELDSLKTFIEAIK